MSSLLALMLLAHAAHGVNPGSLDPTAEAAIARALASDDGARRAECARAAPELVALVLERLVLEGRGAEVTALLDDERPSSAWTALGPHAACLRRAAVAGRAPERSCAPPDASADERYAARREEVAALAGAGLHASARLHALEALELLADANEPARQLAECERILAEPTDMPFPLLDAAVLVRRGEAQKALFDNDSGIRSLEEAARVLSGHPGSPWYAFAEDQLGWAMFTARRHSDCLAAFRRAERAARANHDDDRLARVLRSLATEHRSLGETAEALDLIHESIRVASAAGLTERQIESLLYEANFLVAADDVPRARERLEQARALAGACPFENVGLELLRLRVQRAIETKLDPRAPMSSELAADCERIVPRIEAVYARLQPLIWLTVNALRLGDLERALSWIELAEHLCGDADLPRAIPVALRALYDAQLGRYDEALQGFEQVIRYRDQDLAGLRDLGFERRFERLIRSQEVFHEAVRVAAEAFERTGKPRYAFRALYFLDHARVRNMRQLLGTPAELADYPPLGQDDLAAFESRFAVDRDELLLAFDLDVRVAIALEHGEIRLFRTPDAETIDTSVRFLRHMLVEDPSPKSYAAQARQLSSALLGPVLDWLREGGRIVCLSDAPLQELPLEFLLVDEEREGCTEEPAAGFAELPFLFRRASVVYAPCLPPRTSELSPACYDTILALAYSDPATRLDATRRELELLTRLFGAENVRAVPSAEASEERFKHIAHPAADVLHLGSHVVADRVRGGSSYVALAPGGGEDGCLRVRELVPLDLRYQLVVVAGCEGSAGQPLSAEGILSVGWGLLAAGARQVLVCSTEVEDDLALRWMGAFYRSLREGRAPLQALSDARASLLASTDPEDLRAALLPFHLWRAPR